MNRMSALLGICLLFATGCASLSGLDVNRDGVTAGDHLAKAIQVMMTVFYGMGQRRRANIVEILSEWRSTMVDPIKRAAGLASAAARAV